MTSQKILMGELTNEEIDRLTLERIVDASGVSISPESREQWSPSINLYHALTCVHVAVYCDQSVHDHFTMDIDPETGDHRFLMRSSERGMTVLGKADVENACRALSLMCLQAVELSRVLK